MEEGGIVYILNIMDGVDHLCHTQQAALTRKAAAPVVEGLAAAKCRPQCIRYIHTHYACRWPQRLAQSRYHTGTGRRRTIRDIQGWVSTDVDGHGWLWSAMEAHQSHTHTATRCPPSSPAS